MPPDWRIRGIEAVLQRRPVRQPLGGIGTIIANRIWSLTFVCYDSTQTLDEIDLLILRAFPDAQRRPRAATDDTYEQLNVELPDVVTIQPIQLT